MNFPTIEGCYEAKKRLNNVSINTPFQFLDRISKNFNAEIYTKREDLQLVRSFKIRGAFNKIVALSKHELKNGIVCASGGNHAQGFAFACNHLKIMGTIFMPLPTPKQKIDRVKMFGAEYVKIILKGDTFDDSQKQAVRFLLDVRHLTRVPLLLLEALLLVHHLKRCLLPRHRLPRRRLLLEL